MESMSSHSPSLVRITFALSFLDCSAIISNCSSVRLFCALSGSPASPGPAAEVTGIALRHITMASNKLMILFLILISPIFLVFYMEYHVSDPILLLLHYI